MKRLHKDQGGLTIIELLVVIMLTGLITTAITTTFFQVFNMNARTANHMVAINQVQHAGKLVSEDILEAQNVTLGVSSGFPLTLTWVVNATTHEVIYTIDEGELWKKETIGEGTPTMTRVAEYIDVDQTSIEPDGSGAYEFMVTATVGEGSRAEESETRIYKVQPRPGT